MEKEYGDTGLEPIMDSGLSILEMPERKLFFTLSLYILPKRALKNALIKKCSAGGNG